MNLASLCIPALAAALALSQMAAAQTVRISTTEGDIVVKLDREKAPKTVDNFMAYVKSGHYANTIFHRVVPTFVIQAGGYTANLAEKPTRPAIPLESDNGLSNLRGTIAMARTAIPDSATSQFYFNVQDNLGLDKANARDGNGYAVFGSIVDGMEVVDKIRAVPTVSKPPFTHLPEKPVVIRKVSVEADAPKPANPG